MSKSTHPLLCKQSGSCRWRHSCRIPQQPALRAPQKILFLPRVLEPGGARGRSARGPRRRPCPTSTDRRPASRPVCGLSHTSHTRQRTEACGSKDTRANKSQSSYQDVCGSLTGSAGGHRRARTARPGNSFFLLLSHAALLPPSPLGRRGGCMSLDVDLDRSALEGCPWNQIKPKILKKNLGPLESVLFRTCSQRFRTCSQRNNFYFYP